jgi:cytochrome c oxidase subunit 4
MSSSGHIIGNRFTYFLVFVALMAGTAITVAVTYVHLGWLNLPLALAIAVTKAMLVILFFMHLKDHPKLIKVTFAAAFFFFAILVAHTLSDYLSRPGYGLPPYPASGIVSAP